jgi:sigma-B regulation protein RsbU (phosphoserine phosphatase)
MSSEISAIHGDALFKSVLDTVSDGVALVSKDLKILFHNEIMHRLYGPRVGEYCFKAYRGRETPCDDCIVIDVLKDGAHRRATREIKLPDGTKYWFEISSNPFTDRDGKIIGAVEAIRDVSEQKNAEILLQKTLLERNEVLAHLNSELSEASAYVKTMLPQPITKGNVRTNWRFVPSTSLGGDSFGYHWLDDDHFAIYLLDVSGHGVGAALLSVSVINLLRSHALPDTDFKEPDQVLHGLNKTFPGERHNDMFFTIWYGVYNRSSLRLTFASGGHPPALLFSGSFSEKQTPIQLRTPNFVVGGRPDVTYQSSTHEIRPPSRLYVFSDGVYDITTSGNSIWGLQAFLDFMVKLSEKGQWDMDRLINYAREINRVDAFDDDFTMLEVDFR